MAAITFKAKVRTMYNMDDIPAYQYVDIPKLDRRHCDMASFREHPRYGPLANSDLFPGVLSRIRRDILGPHAKTLRLDRVPEGVEVDTSGFLAVVTIHV